VWDRSSATLRFWAPRVIREKMRPTFFSLARISVIISRLSPTLFQHGFICPEVKHHAHDAKADDLAKKMRPVYTERSSNPCDLSVTL